MFLCCCLVDKDLVSKPPDQVEEAEPGQRHQLSHAGPAVLPGRSRTPRRRQLLPPRSRRRRAVSRRSPLPVRRTEGRRVGPAGNYAARLVQRRTQRFRSWFRHFLLSALPTFYAADILMTSDCSESFCFL